LIHCIGILAVQLYCVWLWLTSLREFRCEKEIQRASQSAALSDRSAEICSGLLLI